MKRIGINQWGAGIDPFLADTLNEFEQKTTQSRKAEQERMSRMAPSEKFLMLAKQRFKNPRLYGIIPAEDFYQIGMTMIEIVKMNLDDVKDAGQFMIFLQSLYVVDAARGNGEGKRAIEQIKQISEESGCCVALFARSFALSKEGYLPNAFLTFDELKKASLEEKWPVIYLHELDCRFFYEGCGFQNICLYESWVYKRPKEQDLPFDSQFVYLPSTMDRECRGQLDNRLNRNMCEFCNRI